MMIHSGRELRQAYLEFFRDRKGFPHPIVAPAPLVPPDDPTLMFTSAGMVQFKSLYSGAVDPLPYPRAATCQKCLRAGGKGSDLENVGKTLRHHTLFEMLGNFSFGDYFKRETVRWAWEFVTVHMKLPKERLFPTIFLDDDEAEAVWKEETDCHYTPVRLNAKENFWGPAGDSGACGPCSELCIFLGSDAELAEIRAAYQKSEADTLKVLEHRICEEGDTFLEIWNMVFPQFDQQKDGSRLPLKNRGIDTGAGLERMTVALKFAQTGKPLTPYETDLMWPVTQAAARALGVPYVMLADGGDERTAKERLAVNAVADHTRALVFCLAEGITPSNVGRGYVLRRIQRRALRFASLLGKDEPFMAELYDPVVEALGDVYPEIKKNPDFIKKALRREEETFLATRGRGEKMLAELVEQAKDRGDNRIPGEAAFRLWDTYGFPVDLTMEVAEDEGLTVDRAGYDSAMKKQKDEARAAWKGAKFDLEAELLDELYETQGHTEFIGYDGTGPFEAEVLAFIHKGSISDELKEGEDALIVLDRTPFYAESGGQVGDTGRIWNAGGTFEVADCQKTPHGIFIHKGRLVSGHLKVGVRVEAAVDAARRAAIVRNHSSVHLLQNALKRLVGEHVTQAGSYVGPEYSRFDFSHGEALTRAQLEELQRDVNALILEDTPVSTEVLLLDEARKKGAIAPFGEKYGASVRVVSMGGGRSVEFCGGTHAATTGAIMRYRITAESSIASGVRRIEAVTGAQALEAELGDQYHVVAPLQTALAVKGGEAVERVESLMGRVRELEKEIARLRRDAVLGNLDAFAGRAEDMGDGTKLCAVRVDGLGSEELRALAAGLRDKLGSHSVAAVLAGADDKVAIVVAVGKDVQAKYPAGKIVNALAGPLGGKGGGKPDMAQGGAKDVAKLDEVLGRAKELVAGV